MLSRNSIFFVFAGVNADFGDFENFHLPEIATYTKYTSEFCYNPNDNKPSLNCPNGQIIEVITVNVNQTAFNYSNLDKSCLEFTKSVHLFMLARTVDLCGGHPYCTVSIDKIETFHSSRVKQMCPQFGPSIFNQICLSVVYICVSQKGLFYNKFIVQQYFLLISPVCLIAYLKLAIQSTTQCFPLNRPVYGSVAGRHDSKVSPYHYVRRVVPRRVESELCERRLQFHTHVAQLSECLPARQKLLAELDAPKQHADTYRAGRSGPRLVWHQAAAVAAATARLPELQLTSATATASAQENASDDLLAAHPNAQLLPRARPLSRHRLEVCDHTNV